MRSLLLGLVAVPVIMISCGVVLASEMLVRGSSMDSLKNQVVIMAEKAKRAQEEAGSNMSLLKLRLAARLAATEESLARQVEILANYEEQLKETTGTDDSDPNRVRLEGLVRHVRSDVASQLEILTDLLKRLQELRERMTKESGLDTPPTIVSAPPRTPPATGTQPTTTVTGPATPPPPSPGGS